MDQYIDTTPIERNMLYLESRQLAARPPRSLNSEAHMSNSEGESIPAHLTLQPQAQSSAESRRDINPNQNVQAHDYMRAGSPHDSDPLLVDTDSQNSKPPQENGSIAPALEESKRFSIDFNGFFSPRVKET